MGVAELRAERALRGRMSPERLVFFADAVFAIAMTLLVIDVHLPEGSSAPIGEQLLDTLPSIFAYAVSFCVIGAYWIGHHRLFLLVQRVDGAVIPFALLQLLFVAFVPFPTSMLYLGDGLSAPAVALYSGTLAAVGAIQLLLLWLTWRRGLLDPGLVDGPIVRMRLARVSIYPLVFGLSVPAALLWPEVTPWCWLVLLPLGAVVGRWDPKPRPGERLIDDAAPADAVPRAEEAVPRGEGADPRAEDAGSRAEGAGPRAVDAWPEPAE